ncbi:MAG: hypothetical protein IKS76_03875 [Paludibacteraceae bacterium]|nr:hypothetical protein [Paludibacteraceae bacterium]
MYKVIVKGRTYDIRDELKRDGANWDKEHKYWYFLCGNEQATRSALKAYNDKERKIFAYVEEGERTEAPERPRERVVLWFTCDNIANVHEVYLKSEEAEETALRSIRDFGKVYVDMNGDIRDPEGLTLADVDEVRELDLSKDLR